MPSSSDPVLFPPSSPPGHLHSARSSQSVLGAPPHPIFNINSSLPAPLSSLSNSPPLGVELMVGNSSSKSPFFCILGEPFHGPESSKGISVHSPMADSFCCRPSAFGAPPRANVLDGFNGGSTSLSDFVDPSIP
ncbi:hypothetical protein Nepgr_027727 [Nepenthes gracilis]|uniref:Uncharacterized protein n=1 Tax=Nepenthes gracilis TaxID=150966 RepID=A0AAD3TAU6_NEPGR|nr:hypothetical protein Nepgr_027727 [Nepenthes gracilis]